MLFSGIPFLFYFLPIFLVLYYAVPGQLKNALLVTASLIFYAWGEPKYVFLMIGAILAGYLFGILIELTSQKRMRQGILGAAVLFFAVLLGYFKYADFLIWNINAATGATLSLLQIALPIGISFYIFQVLSYVVDVYRGEPAQKNLILLAAYVSMFPQLIAGPIVRYKDVAAQLAHRTLGIEKTACGIRRFVTGLAKKILLANALGQLCDIFQASAEKSVLFYWMYAAAFTLHIYFDFSGYSDMAIGLGRMLGFTFLENFDYPYISGSITEFWRRWHISLGSWFRDYVYIPLGGNRVKKARWFFNIFVVWFLTGFWHGASWNFILWGLLFAVLLVNEKMWLLPYLEKAKFWRHVYVMLFVMLGFVLFNASDLRDAAVTVGGLFGIGQNLPLWSAEAVYYLRSYALVFVLAVAGATPWPAKMAQRLKNHEKTGALMAAAEPVVCVVLMLVMTAYLVDGSFNPFLYFRF